MGSGPEYTPYESGDPTTQKAYPLTVSHIAIGGAITVVNRKKE